MYIIAFTLGFFGSLHCIGMCGPLAIGMLSRKHEVGLRSVLSSTTYNLGRTISYITIGAGFGLMGSAISLVGIQKVISISLGLIMILFFLFSINPDQLISKQPLLHLLYSKVSRSLNLLTQRSDNISPINLGIINGFLPCGLVYLAVAGALSLSNLWGSMGFMFFFGLGTFPAMLGMTLGYQSIGQSFKPVFRKLYPIITLFMGIYLIYRGVLSKMPLELNFFEALKAPIMCH
ncbi:MAG: sulfite exporter TauE/SafE family protein [Saprospiraceae bacterium]|nr:sulfite exporter TauE/SafE family protein [Saprospiraceae bacterium]